MLELGTKLPAFSLTNGLNDIAISEKGEKESKGILVMFICNHCPFVLHVAEEIARVGNLAKKNGFHVVAINSNDVENYPDDSPENMHVFAQDYGFEFPYVFDSTQRVAKSFRAACTPDFFLFDRNDWLVYRGQLDGARPENGVPVTGDDLRQALTALEEGKPIQGDQTPSIGCNIKWKN